jgi:hypothetical protein
MLCGRGWWLILPIMENRRYPADLAEPRVSEAVCHVENEP